MSENHISVDGSQGEGGGQIVRSSLALSMVTGKPVSIERVRAGRDKPGLMRQHLTAVRAAQQICDAQVTGDSIGSFSLSFQPGKAIPGEYRFAVGTAGSATLVLQTVLPPLLIASAPSRLILEGGTHNPWAPPFDFLRSAYLPLINRMGPTVTATLEQYGFYPAGGGRFVVDIQPATRLGGFELLERGTVRTKRGRILLSNLSAHIAERERKELQRLTTWDQGQLIHENVVSAGPGNVVMIELECDHVTEVFIGFGEHSVKAETVAKRTVEAMRDYLAANVPVGPYLADQLLLPLGISIWQSKQTPNDQPVRFRTASLTDHSLTQINVLKSFLGISVVAQIQDTDKSVTVTLGSGG